MWTNHMKCYKVLSVMDSRTVKENKGIVEHKQLPFDFLPISEYR